MAGKITKQELHTTLVSEIEGGAMIQQPTPPSGVKEGRIWLDTSDNVFQGTVLDGVTEHLDDEVKHVQDLKLRKSGKDAEGIFTVYEQLRTDGTLAIKSVLSGGATPMYTTRTITYYAANGTSILKTVTRTLTYDADGDLVSEV